jgi:hypothetical protein
MRPKETKSRDFVGLIFLKRALEFECLLDEIGAEDVLQLQN